MKQPHLSKTDLDKLIASIGSRGRKLDNDIQDAGVGALQHLQAHGDIGFVNRLYVALGKGHRRAALSSWLMAYGALAPNTDKETHLTAPFKFDKTKTTRADAAEEDCWYNHKPDPQPAFVFDLQKAIEQVIKRASSKNAQVLHGELLTPLQGLVSMLHSAARLEAPGALPEASEEVAELPPALA